MNIIKGLALLPEGIDIDKLEAAALLHRRHSNITFKIKEVTDKSITIQAVQGKNTGGNYFPQKRLIEIVHETFDCFFPGQKILVNAIPFISSPVDKVTADWISKKMIDTGVKLKDLVKDTGLNNTQLSSWINGLKPISQQGKAMFYYYFLNKSA